MENLAIAQQVTEQTPEQQVLEARFDFYETTSLIRSLIELLSFELELLSQMKIDDLKPMQVKKNQLSDDLEKQLRAYEQNKAVKASMTAARAQELRQLLKEYETVMAAYHDELFKAQQVNESTIKMIVQLVREHAQRSNGYGKNGTRSGVTEFNNGSYGSIAPALKFNQQI